MGEQTTITTDTEQPRVYVACLAAYNNGRLHGAWMDAAREPWALWDDIRAMLQTSPVKGAEEFAIHDYEGFGGVRIAEYAGIERVAEIASFIVEHGEFGAAVLAYCDGDLDEAREAITDRYLGVHDSLADYVREFHEACSDIPEHLRNYIDWEAMARDEELGGELFAIETGHEQTHVFMTR